MLFIEFVCCTNGYYANLFDGLDEIHLANVELVLARTLDDVIEEISGFNIEKLHFEELQPYVNFTLRGMKSKDGGVKQVQVPFETLYSIYSFQHKHDHDEMTNEPLFKLADWKDY